MKPPTHTTEFLHLLWITLSFLFFPSASGTIRGQEMAPIESWRDSILPRDLAWLNAQSSNDTSSAGHASRSWLFRMPLPQSCSVLGLDSDPDSPTDEAAAIPSPKESDSSRWQLLLGSDNPFLDLRLPGDPGGPGYYKLYSQISLLDTPTTGLIVGVQAVTPAGLEADGVASGPTIFSPTLAWSCNLSDGACFHAFVSKNLRANSRWAGSLGHPHFGMAVESPWPFADNSSGRWPNVFLEALSRPLAPAGQRSLRYLDLLPGLHWRLSENWWFTSGVLVPLAEPRLDATQLQITCSWQF